MHALQGPLSKNLALSPVVPSVKDVFFLSFTPPKSHPLAPVSPHSVSCLVPAPGRCCFNTPGSYLHKTLNKWEVRLGVEHFIHEHYALGLMTISHYTYCPCDCHKRLRNIKANYLIAGRCANLFPPPAPMFSGNTFKGKKNISLETLCKRDTRQPQWLSPHSRGTDEQGTARQRTGPSPSPHQQGTGGCSQPLPPQPHATSACCLPLPCPVPLLQRKHRRRFSQHSPGLMPWHIPWTQRPSRQNKGNFTKLAGNTARCSCCQPRWSTRSTHRARVCIEVSKAVPRKKQAPSHISVHLHAIGWKKEHPSSVKLCSSFL